MFKKQKILIVDDEQFNRQAIKIILQIAGISDTESICDTGYNGEQAVQRVREDFKAKDLCSYDLIIIDKNMPIMDGCTATEQIR